jgi:two-component system sensor histidine kinase KdpD
VTLKDKRPDPDALLKRIQADEGKPLERRGLLKIFLGYAAGVGKTYTMLEEARSRQKEGIDIVAGLVETHGRTDTESLLADLSLIPPLMCQVGGVQVKEMDLDEVLKRHPRIVLVDELAHTNSSCMRHSKRYQDVEELLEAGISVYTTLNVQHIESLNDAVQDITRIRVDETVPDRIIEMADDIELIDIPPETLLERLKEGKVYLPEKAEQAMRRFFQKGHLLGLRELSLRYAAWKVDTDMRSYMTSHAILGPWPAGTRLLVCVSPSPLSKHAIRAARQLAEGLGAEWFAVYVEPQRQLLSAEDRDQLSRNLKLAEELGSTIKVITGSDVVDEIIRFARDTNITLILAGSPRRPAWQELIRGPLVYDLVRKSGTIDVLVVGSPLDTPHKAAQKPGMFPLGWRTIVGPVVLTAMVTLVLYISQARLEFLNIAMLFLVPVLIASVLWGRTAGILATFLAITALDFFFVRPTFSFAIEDLRYLPSFLVFLLVALATSMLADALRRQSLVSNQRDRFISAMFSFTTMLLSFPGQENSNERLDSVLVQAAEKIHEVFECEVIILLPGHSGLFQQVRVGSKTPFDDEEVKVATWVLSHNTMAGRGTDTFSSARWACIPIKTHNGILGVLSFRSEQPDQILAPDKRQILVAFTNVLAISLEGMGVRPYPDRSRTTGPREESPPVPAEQAEI